MKKKAMPLAVGAATAVVMSTAQAAMYVNDRGTGEALVFPFYSAENGNSTLINIANTTMDHKAVKVRIIEAQNSAEVLDFNLYLSPEDHFSFAISATDEGGAQLVTGDNSCTVPAIDGPVAFRNFAYDEDAADDDPDTAADESFDNTGIGRTQVGYIEVIEMGQLDEDAAAAEDAMNMAAAITHDSDGVPANCQQLVDAWSVTDGVAGAWLAEYLDPTIGRGVTDMESAWSGGGLYGYGVVINVPQGAAIGYDATAIAAAVDTTTDVDLPNRGTGWAMHYEPGDKQPNFLDSAFKTESLVADGAGNTNAMEFSDVAAYDDDGVAGLQAINSTIMATEIYNDYVTDPAIAATTDWVLTFPTKTFHVTAAPLAYEPFSERWNGLTACEPAKLFAVDREESTPPIVPPGSSGPDFSPKPPGLEIVVDENDLPLCYETTILQFADESAAGTSTVAIGVGDLLDANDGWATLSLDPAVLDANVIGDGISGCQGAIGTADNCARQITDGTSVLTGLPVVGFAVQKYVNGDLGGLRANYAMSTEHKSMLDQSTAN
jgi:hypothetical protein